jgi:hypothetical protein
MTKPLPTTETVLGVKSPICITKEEGDEFHRQEGVIQQESERLKRSHLRIGEALSAIKKGQLYRARFPTFEQYCEMRWGMNRQRGYQLIDAFEIYTALPDAVKNFLHNDSQVRVLRLAAPGDRAEIVKEAQSQLPTDHVLTASDLRKAINCKYQGLPPNAQPSKRASKKTSKSSASASLPIRFETDWRKLTRTQQQNFIEWLDQGKYFEKFNLRLQKIP